MQVSTPRDYNYESQSETSMCSLGNRHHLAETKFSIICYVKSRGQINSNMELLTKVQK